MIRVLNVFKQLLLACLRGDLLHRSQPNYSLKTLICFLLGIQLNYYSLQGGGGEFLPENEVRGVTIPETALRTAKSNWFISILHPVVSGECVSFLQLFWRFM